MMNIQATLTMLLAVMFLVIGTTTAGTPQLRRALKEAGEVPICVREGEAVYKMHLVKEEREIYFHEKAVHGRCGPENCKMLCLEVEKAVSFHSYGTGVHCECLFE
jgi:hypothetical protein